MLFSLHGYHHMLVAKADRMLAVIKERRWWNKLGNFLLLLFEGILFPLNLSTSYKAPSSIWKRKTSRWWKPDRNHPPRDDETNQFYSSEQNFGQRTIPLSLHFLDFPRFLFLSRENERNHCRQPQKNFVSSCFHSPGQEFEGKTHSRRSIVLLWLVTHADSYPTVHSSLLGFLLIASNYQGGGGWAE